MPSILLAVAFAGLPADTDVAINQSSHVTIRGTTPFQDGAGKWLPQMRNPSIPGTDPFGQPNNHFPWLNPGGVAGNKRPDGFEVVKEYDIPEPGPKTYWSTGVLRKNYIAPNRLQKWTFPVGTVAKARLFDHGKEFAVHVSTKTREGHGIECWDGEEIIKGKVPPYYTSPNNCTDCHQDTGKHARVLFPNRQNYYYWVRGSDGRFSWWPNVGKSP